MPVAWFKLTKLTLFCSLRSTSWSTVTHIHIPRSTGLKWKLCSLFTGCHGASRSSADDRFFPLYSCTHLTLGERTQSRLNLF